MNHSVRNQLYQSIEEYRKSKVLTYVTDVPSANYFGVHPNCVEQFAHILDEHIGITDRITLILHTTGGVISTAWQLVNLIKMYCDNLEILIPSRALSAGTLISLGANKIIMTKQSILSPIDPQFQIPLDFTNDGGGQEQATQVSVEELVGFFEFAKNELSIKNEEIFGKLLIELTKGIHPIRIGSISRSRSQMRKLANNLLKSHIKKIYSRKKIIKFLCSDSGSHDYTINRREAAKLGLNIEKPSVEFYQRIKEIKESYLTEMTPKYSEGTIVDSIPTNNELKLYGTLLECSTASYGLISKGAFKKANIAPNITPNNNQQTDEQIEIEKYMLVHEPFKWEQIS